MKGLLIWSISKFFSIIYLLILIRIILSWVKVNSYNKYIALIFQLTDFILDPFKRLIYRLGIDTGFLDLSPIVAYFVLQLVETALKRVIWQLL
ncbi:MAG: YggT family protein [Firmicutes bacterium]|nr:YggT family protein [Bacillota bacterium]